MSTANKGSELRSRFLFLVGALIIFRAGTFIPVPGVDTAALAAFFDQQAGKMLALFKLFVLISEVFIDLILLYLFK